MESSKEKLEQVQKELKELEQKVNARKGLISMLVLRLSKTTDETLETTSVEELVQGFFQEEYDKEDKQFELEG